MRKLVADRRNRIQVCETVNILTGNHNQLISLAAVKSDKKSPEGTAMPLANAISLCGKKIKIIDLLNRRNHTPMSCAASRITHRAIFNQSFLTTQLRNVIAALLRLAVLVCGHTVVISGFRFDLDCSKERGDTGRRNQHTYLKITPRLEQVLIDYQ